MRKQFRLPMCLSEALPVLSRTHGRWSTGPLEVHLLDFPNAVIKGSKLQSCLSKLAERLRRFGDMMLKATKPPMALFNIYDDWLKTIFHTRQFSWPILILHALYVNTRKPSCCWSMIRLLSLSLTTYVQITSVMTNGWRWKLHWRIWYHHTMPRGTMSIHQHSCSQKYKT